jgi:hypothetical protein
MIDKTRTPRPTPRKAGKADKRDPLPSFLPVPRQCQRHDGWTPERQRQFIEALADTGSVRAAAHAVNMAPEGAYLLRRHPEGGPFRKAWEAALKLGVQRLEDVAMDRALNGVEVPVYSYGKLVGTRTVHNDRLVMFLLRNRAPGRFAGGRPKALSALDKASLEKMKKQWRKEWERERYIAESAEDRETGDDFVEAIRARHVRWWGHLTPRARAAYIEFRRIESEDRDYDWRDAEDPEAIIAEYEEAFADDHRAPIGKLIEADGLADDTVLGDDLPADPPHHRLITLKDDTWDFRRDGDDGRCSPV